MQISHRNFINPPQELPSDDPLGIETWAASSGQTVYGGVAIATSILTGVMGSFRSFPLPSAQPDDCGVNLAAMESDSLLAMAVGQLVGPLRAAESALILKSKQFTAAELDDALYMPGLRSRNADYLTMLGNPESPEYNYITAGDSLAYDLQVNRPSVVYESLARPRFMLDGSLPQNLPKVLSECHVGFALAGGAVEALPASTSKRNQRISEILAAFRGGSVERSSGANQTKITRESTRLTGLLRLPKADFDWTLEHRRDLFTMAVPVFSATESGGEEVDEWRAIGFQNHFKQVATSALALRRTHTPRKCCFTSDVACGEFMRQQRAYVRELQEVPDDCRIPAAAGLPAAMAWALLLLAGESNLDDYILHTVFSAARALHADAVRLFVEHDQVALAEHRLGVARKLVTRLASIGPCKRRGLVRGLDQQALHLHEPVIQALIGIGIVTEDPNRVLRLGRVPIHQLTAKSLIHDIQP